MGYVMTKWEYKTILFQALAADPEKLLNELGEEGWEMCEKIVAIVVFKRVKE